jgi:Pyruvate/2-oxoacid:ferredoxin oxidoreductase delta subunit
MGKGDVMSEDIYVKLREFMDTMPAGYPTTPDGLEIRILKKLFTPDDAEMVMKLKNEPEEVSAIAARIGMDEVKLTEKLEDMAKRALVFRTRSEDKVFYNAHSFVVGIYEFRFDHLDREFCEMFEEYLPQYMAPLAFIKTKQTRTVPIKSAIAMAPQAESYNQVRELIKEEKLISLQECLCRKEQKALGNICRFPKYTCLGFGNFGRYYIDNGWGKQIDVDQAMKILDDAEEMGLVLTSLNTQELEVICCCCTCCCPSLRFTKLLRQPAAQNPPYYQSQINPNLCISCGTCIERCPMDAIKAGDDGILTTIKGRCIGCGVCVPTCQERAISMVPNPDKAAPPKTMTDMFKQVGEERKNLKL